MFYGWSNETRKWFALWVPLGFPLALLIVAVVSFLFGVPSLGFRAALAKLIAPGAIEGLKYIFLLYSIFVGFLFGLVTANKLPPLSNGVLQAVDSFFSIRGFYLYIGGIILLYPCYLYNAGFLICRYVRRRRATPRTNAPKPPAPSKRKGEDPWDW